MYYENNNYDAIRIQEVSNYCTLLQCVNFYYSFDLRTSLYTKDDWYIKSCLSFAAISVEIKPEKSEILLCDVLVRDIKCTELSHISFHPVSKSLGFLLGTIHRGCIKLEIAKVVVIITVSDTYVYLLIKFADLCIHVCLSCHLC